MGTFVDQSLVAWIACYNNRSCNFALVWQDYRSTTPLQMEYLKVPCRLELNQRPIEEQLGTDHREEKRDPASAIRHGSYDDERGSTPGSE